MKPQHYLADLGNSAIKIARYRASGVRRRWTWYDEDWRWDRLNAAPIHWTVACASTSRLKRWQAALRRSRPGDRVRVVQRADVPMPDAVDEPGRLGIDRIVAAWQAWRQYGERGWTIVIDAGTAVTVDWVDPRGVFQGGLIFAGLQTSRSALASVARTLPNLQPVRPRSPRWRGERVAPLGRNTRIAVERGTLYATAGAIIHAASSLKKLENRSGTIVMTGGDIPILYPLLPKEYRYEPDLILQGMAEIVRMETSP